VEALAWSAGLVGRNTMESVLLWGLLAGLVHFVVIAILYANPIVDGLSRGLEQGPAVKQWPSKPRYFATQFCGTQVEVYLLTTAFMWLRPLIGMEGYAGALALGLLLSAIRVYPRFWNMWIQTTYPNRLLAIEVVNGTLGTMSIIFFLQAAALR
jgi:hypothetical protein